MTEQTTITNTANWLDEEIKNTHSGSITGERLPTLKLEPNKITKFTIDFSNPFNKWSDGKITKAIIPVTHKGERKNIWINIKNPLYGQIIQKGKTGQTEFAISTTGTQSETRYTIVEED